jgi:hypothetical protein
MVINLMKFIAIFYGERGYFANNYTIQPTLSTEKNISGIQNISAES